MKEYRLDLWQGKDALLLFLFRMVYRHSTTRESAVSIMHLYAQHNVPPPGDDEVGALDGNENVGGAVIRSLVY